MTLADLSNTQLSVLALIGVEVTHFLYVLVSLYSLAHDKRS
jgi:hypothetical protein